MRLANEMSASGRGGVLTGDQHEALFGSGRGAIMKIQEVILRAVVGKLQWWQAAEILGVVGRCGAGGGRYREHGYDGLYDRRKGKPSPKRVRLETVEKVLQLYRQEYSDHEVWHFSSKVGVRTRDRAQLQLG